MFAKDYRARAWEKLRGNWGMAILVCFLYALIVGAISALPVAGVASLLISGPLAVGLATAFLSLSRTGETKVDVLFGGFTQNFVNNFLAYLLQTLFVFLWTLLFIIPGIVKGYSYAMTYYILADHPEMSANDAITRSREMMRGHKWQLFCLHFSFIGWILLSVITCGILFIWVVPYMQQADAEFYENIKGEDNKPSEESDASEQPTA